MAKKKRKKNTIEKFFKKWNNLFCSLVLCRKNLERDLIIFLSFVFVFVAVIFSHKNYYLRANHSFPAQQNMVSPSKVPDEDEKISEIQSSADYSQLLPYKNERYGFEIKYPSGWQNPIAQKKIRASKWEEKFEFRKSDTNENYFYEGFDVVVYDLGKIKELGNTDEFPLKTEQKNSKDNGCEDIPGHLLENENFPAERMYIAPGDDCFNSALFYFLVGDEYLFNIVPKIKEEAQIKANPRSLILKEFPEFFSISTTLNLIDIDRPRLISSRPRIFAPRPYAATKNVNGKMACAKKNDDPGKSKQNKKKHMDMECCLDPDEIPNPHCYYSPEKYGKYL
jgi:hypothetical protein